MRNQHFKFLEHYPFYFLSKTLLTALALIPILFLTIHLWSRSTIDNIFKEKLNSISRIFISSYNAVYTNTANEKNAFDYAIKTIEGIDNIRITRVFNENRNILFSYPEDEKDAPILYLEDSPFQSTIHGGKEYARSLIKFEVMGNETRMLEMFTPIDEATQLATELTLRVDISITIAIALLIIIILILVKKHLTPLKTISDEINGIEFHNPSSWRQLHQQPEDISLNKVIVSVNELIFRAQRSLVCQENIGKFLAHEIKTPLTNLMNEIELERNAYTHNIRRKTDKTFYQQAIDDILKIRTIVNNICDLAYIDSDIHFEKDILLNQLVHVAIKEFELVYGHKIILENNILNKEAYVHVNPEYFWILCSNILRNSIEHGQGTHTRPEVHLSEVNNKYRVEFTDSGPGFPFSKKTLESISEENNVEQLLKSHGAGLVLCLKLAEIMNIDVTFENTSPRGSMVTFLFEKPRK